MLAILMVIAAASCSNQTSRGANKGVCGLRIDTGREILAPDEVLRPSRREIQVAPPPGESIPPPNNELIANEIWQLSADCQRGVRARIVDTSSTYTVATKSTSTGLVAIALSVSSRDILTGKLYVYRMGRLVGVGSLAEPGNEPKH